MYGKQFLEPLGTTEHSLGSTTFRVPIFKLYHENYYRFWKMFECCLLVVVGRGVNIEQFVSCLTEDISITH